MVKYHDTRATHRCELSVKRGLSIHWCNPYKGLNIYDCNQFGWWLLRHDEDFETSSHYLQPITRIEFCPCCGTKLAIPQGEIE